MNLKRMRLNELVHRKQQDAEVAHELILFLDKLTDDEDIRDDLNGVITKKQERYLKTMQEEFDNLPIWLLEYLVSLDTRLTELEENK